MHSSPFRKDSCPRWTRDHSSIVALTARDTAARHPAPPTPPQVRDTPQELRQVVGCGCKGECGDKTKGVPICEHITEQDKHEGGRKGLDGKIMKNRLPYNEHKRLRVGAVCRYVVRAWLAAPQITVIVPVGCVSFLHVWESVAERKGSGARARAGGDLFHP